MEIDFDRTDFVGLYELLDNYTEALKFVTQKKEMKMLRYNVDDLNSMYIEKVLHHMNKRVYDWDHDERTRIYYG